MQLKPKNGRGDDVLTEHQKEALLTIAEMADSQANFYQQASNKSDSYASKRMLSDMSAACLDLALALDQIVEDGGTVRNALALFPERTIDFMMPTEFLIHLYGVLPVEFVKVEPDCIPIKAYVKPDDSKLMALIAQLSAGARS